MAYVLQYVDKNEHVVERFVGLVHVSDTTSISLKKAIDVLFSRHGLSNSRLRGQSYDGASNMRALMGMAKKHEDIVSLFTFVANLINVVSGSCKRCDILREKQASIVIEALNNVIVTVLETLTDEESSKKKFKNYIADMRSNSEFEGLKGIGDLVKKLVETKRDKVHSPVYLHVTLALILPVTTASVERAFFAMNIMKNRLRNKIGDEWMSDSLIIYIEKEISSGIDNEVIIRCFQNMKSRRGQL
ncbi:uncharacterized protein LOC132301007 [Cornus florida]|uniref:uncharacterized protein LOC132301007 n=1 Tax=Cornus florida TaxID=4283 RepID=UPI00289C0475|nr:uncharacterized protein LOC132301007 [Cornus florida]